MNYQALTFVEHRLAEIDLTIHPPSLGI